MTAAPDSDQIQRVALVTGASRGLGKAIATQLAADGHHVVLVARSADAIEAVAADITSSGGSVACHPCDLSDDVAVDALSVTANCDLTTAMKRFVEKGEAHVPVVLDETSNQLIGLIHDFDVSYAYHRAMLVAEGAEDLPANAEWSREKSE